MMATAYGDYPETAALRMRWAREIARDARRFEPARDLLAA